MFIKKKLQKKHLRSTFYPKGYMKDDSVFLDKKETVVHSTHK